MTTFCSSQQENWTQKRFKRIELFETTALTSIHERIKIRGIKNTTIEWIDAKFYVCLYGKIKVIENKKF